MRVAESIHKFSVVSVNRIIIHNVNNALAIILLKVQICSIGVGLINKVKMSVQELGDQRGEGPYFLKGIYFLEDTWYYCLTVFSLST